MAQGETEVVPVDQGMHKDCSISKSGSNLFFSSAGSVRLHINNPDVAHRGSCCCKHLHGFSFVGFNKEF